MCTDEIFTYFDCVKGFDIEIKKCNTPRKKSVTTKLSIDNTAIRMW